VFRIFEKEAEKIRFEIYSEFEPKWFLKKIDVNKNNLTSNLKFY